MSINNASAKDSPIFLDRKTAASLSGRRSQAKSSVPTQQDARESKYSYRQAFSLFQSNSNVVINEFDGSGKTLAYLLPIMNAILQRNGEKRQQSGAIILTLNKELVLQIYRQIRLIDFSNKIAVNRSGSITHYSPVIE